MLGGSRLLTSAAKLVARLEHMLGDWLLTVRPCRAAHSAARCPPTTGAEVPVLQRAQAGRAGGRLQPALPARGVLQAALLRIAWAAAVLLRVPPLPGDGGRD